jgi:hypothetical protein
MAIRIVLALAVAAAALSPGVSAEPYWKGPGWYVVADTIVGPFVWQGPYDSQDKCEAAKPADEEDADYACEYLNERPSWDE